MLWLVKSLASQGNGYPRVHLANTAYPKLWLAKSLARQNWLAKAMANQVSS